MKIRFCCMKSMRAQWSKWGAWSDCSASCDGGTKVRRKTCKDSTVKGDKKSYRKQCVGMESETRLKLLSEQRISCNIQPCPDDFQWTKWSQWSSCGSSCGKGTKERWRDCSPAQNGGKECPDKRKHIDNYHQVRDCTLRDCDIFFPGPWSSWSQCSATCGAGRYCRERNCFSQQTRQQVDRGCCVNNVDPDDYYRQCNPCKLAECPVNGGWSKWESWSSCTQNCISYPADGKTINTKARRTRRRWCISPPPAFGGRPCPKSGQYKWIAHEKAELDTTHCVTELSKEEGAKVTPWCPENCIFTPWSEWSGCSQTCIVGMDVSLVRSQNSVTQSLLSRATRSSSADTRETIPMQNTKWVRTSSCCLQSLRAPCQRGRG